MHYFQIVFFPEKDIQIYTGQIFVIQPVFSLPAFLFKSSAFVVMIARVLAVGCAVRGITEDFGSSENIYKSTGLFAVNHTTKYKERLQKKKYRRHEYIKC